MAEDVLQEGDKIKIISKDGQAYSTEIFHKGESLKWVSGINIKINPGEHIKADLVMISPVLDIEATVGAIIDSNPKLDEIRKIIEKAGNDLSESTSDDKSGIKAVALSKIAEIVKL